MFRPLVVAIIRLYTSSITLYLHIVIVYFSVYKLMMATMRGRNM
jgi:hypothetical protein